MSTPFSTVSLCVDAVVSAYHEAVKLIQYIKAEREAISDDSALDSLTHELEASLHRGEQSMRDHFNHDLGCSGDLFACGDRKSKFTIILIIFIRSRSVRGCKGSLEGHSRQLTTTNYNEP